MRTINFYHEGVYHIYNRGVDKRNIFNQTSDYLRFLKNLLSSNLRIKPRQLKTLNIKSVAERNPSVKLLSFCLMPNHFHLKIQQLIDGGVTDFLSRLANGYTKYFNAKYDRSGRLYESPYKAKEVSSTGYLLHLSRYIHLNPIDLLPTHENHPIEKKMKYAINYRWSSLGDYLSMTRYNFINKNKVLGAFDDASNYKKYLEHWLEYRNSIPDVDPWG